MLCICSVALQMIVPKRAALLLDRLMVALHHALEDGDQEGVQRISDMYRYSRQQQPSRQLPTLEELQQKSLSLSSDGIRNTDTTAYPAAKESTSKFVPNFSFEGTHKCRAMASVWVVLAKWKGSNMPIELTLFILTRGRARVYFFSFYCLRLCVTQVSATNLRRRQSVAHTWTCSSHWTDDPSSRSNR